MGEKSKLQSTNITYDLSQNLSKLNHAVIIIYYPLITDNESAMTWVVLIPSADPHPSSAARIEQLLFEKLPLIY